MRTKGVCVNCSGCMEIKSCVRRCECWLRRELIYAPGNDRKWLGVPGAKHQSKTHCMKISGSLSLDPGYAPMHFTLPTELTHEEPELSWVGGAKCVSGLAWPGFRLRLQLIFT